MVEDENKKEISERVENIKKSVKNFTANFHSLKIKQKEVLKEFVEDFKKKKGR